MKTIGKEGDMKRDEITSLGNVRFSHLLPELIARAQAGSEEKGFSDQEHAWWEMRAQTLSSWDGETFRRRRQPFLRIVNTSDTGR